MKRLVVHFGCEKSQFGRELVNTLIRSREVGPQAFKLLEIDKTNIAAGVIHWPGQALAGAKRNRERESSDNGAPVARQTYVTASAINPPSSP